MEGHQIITLNPQMFEDCSVWAYADLQKLCTKLGLSGKGKRAELEMRLRQWHKARTVEGHCMPTVEGTGGEDAPDSFFPLNVDGSNFSIFHVNVKSRSPVGATGSTSNGSGSSSRNNSSSSSSSSSSDTRGNSSSSSSSGSSSSSSSGEGTASLKKFTSLLGLGASPTVVSPTLLRPLALVTTPNKSILRTPGSGGSKRKAGLKFSPFNGTKVIPNRRQQPGSGSPIDGDYMHRPDQDGKDDEDDLDDESGYVDEISRINAEKNSNLAEENWDNSF